MTARASLLILSAMTFVFCQLPSAQHVALMEIFDTIGCPETSPQCPRFNESSPCTSSTIECNEQGVKRLTLSSHTRGGSIPTVVGRLTALTWLSISHSRLTGTIPTELASLSQLTWVDFSTNQLGGATPLSWTLQIPQLTYLHLDSNNFSDAFLSIRPLINLEFLSLARNGITGTLPTQFGTLTALTFLALNHNNLSGTIPTQFGLMKQLGSLFLATNLLHGTLPTEVGSLSTCSDLYVTSNRLTGTIPPELYSLTRLTGLYLSDNQFTGSLLPAVGQLTNLRVFNFDDNQLQGSIPTEIANARALSYLSVNNNQFGGTVPQQLSRLTALSLLRVVQNRLAGVVPDINLTSDGWCDLGNSQLNGNCFSACLGSGKCCDGFQPCQAMAVSEPTTTPRVTATSTTNAPATSTSTSTTATASLSSTTTTSSSSTITTSFSPPSSSSSSSSSSSTVTMATSSIDQHPSNNGDALTLSSTLLSTMSNTIDMTAGSTFASLTASTTNVIVETVSVDDDTVWTPAAIGGIVGAGVLLLMFLCVALIATCIVTRRRLARANAQVADSVRQRESEQISSASHEYGIIATSQTNYVDHAIKPLDRSPYDELRAHEATSDLPTVNHSDL